MPFVVVSDVIETTDTSVHAHVRLPAAAWGEKGGTVTNSDRTISRQRAFMAAPGEAKPDWWIVSEVGRRMGWKTAFSYDRSAEIWREHCRLSSYENDSARLFALPGHAAKGNAEYDAMTPFRWGGAPFADGRFSTPDGRARLVPVVQKPVASPLTQWPMTPNTGRYRDQWRTMTRTGLSPKLARHREEPLVEIYPTTQYGWGSSMAAWRACNHAAGQQHLPRDRRRDAEGPRTVRADPLDRPYRYRRLCRGAPPPGRRPNLGSAGLKSTPVRIEPIATEWRGFVVVRGELATRPDCLWATRVAVPGGTAWDMAGNGDAAALDALLPKG